MKAVTSARAQLAVLCFFGSIFIVIFSPESGNNTRHRYSRHSLLQQSLQVRENPQSAPMISPPSPRRFAPDVESVRVGEGVAPDEVESASEKVALSHEDVMKFLGENATAINKTWSRLPKDEWRFEYGADGMCKPERPLSNHDRDGKMLSFGAGEDAYFVEDQCVGIADGVGGWNMQGLSSARFSRLLMHLSAEYFRNISQELDHEIPNPMETLQMAYDKMPLGLIGSTTACLAIISDGRIHTATLGDSSYLILRNNTVAYKGQIQEHGFNHPFQLSDKLLIAYTKAQSINPVATEWPRDALLASHDVEEGDILLVVTDGILDNLWDHDIELATQTWQKSDQSSNVTALASKLTALAANIAQRPNVPTPFQVKANQNGFAIFGGKSDDIAVVACRVVRQSNLSRTKRKSPNIIANSTISENNLVSGAE
ncbi:hypothetical protein AAMO2058_000800800 [Amorphochlora amoebiformis]